MGQEQSGSSKTLRPQDVYEDADLNQSQLYSRQVFSFEKLLLKGRGKLGGDTPFKKSWVDRDGVHRQHVPSHELV